MSTQFKFRDFEALISAPVPESIVKASAILRSGGLVAFPTETVYGLGADATNETAVRFIYALKGRPSNNPLIVHTYTPSEIVNLARGNLSTLQQAQIEALSIYWPGPLTIVVPKGPTIAPSVTGGGNTMGIRIPNHPVALSLLKELGRPICAPSANPSGYVSPTTAAHVLESFGERSPFILDGGSCVIGIESTVLSLLGPVPTILRPGAITAQMIESALHCGVEIAIPSETASSQEAKLSPGLLSQHYSPHTRLIIEGMIQQNAYPLRVGIIRMRSAGDRSDSFPYTQTAVLSATGNLEEIARNLFATLREMDGLGLDLIVVEPCQSEGLGSAIMDRIRRAAAGA